MSERYIEFETGKMYYYLEGAGETLVFLHGWGQNFYTFKKVTDYFKNNYQILGVDFLGFGYSDEPNKPLTIDDYTSYLQKLFEELKITNPIIIGHSFGGKVALNYAANNEVKKLILVSSAGIRKRSLKYFYKVYKYKFLKKVYKIISKKKLQELKDKSGSSDYKNASDIMKQTLSKVVNYNSIKDMKKISTRTYLLWGVHDTTTPYLDGVKMHELINESDMILFYNSGHFCYLQEEKKFINTLEKIL